MDLFNYEVSRIDELLACNERIPSIDYYRKSAQTNSSSSSFSSSSSTSTVYIDDDKVFYNLILKEALELEQRRWKSQAYQRQQNQQQEQRNSNIDMTLQTSNQLRHSILSWMLDICVVKQFQDDIFPYAAMILDKFLLSRQQPAMIEQIEQEEPLVADPSVVVIDVDDDLDHKPIGGSHQHLRHHSNVCNSFDKQGDVQMMFSNEDELKLRQLYQFAACSLLIATKMRQTRLSSKNFIDELAEFSRSRLTPIGLTGDEIRQAEYLILFTLNWDYAIVTPNDYLPLLMRKCEKVLYNSFGNYNRAGDDFKSGVERGQKVDNYENEDKMQLTYSINASRTMNAFCRDERLMMDTTITLTPTTTPTSIVNDDDDDDNEHHQIGAKITEEQEKNFNSNCNHNHNHRHHRLQNQAYDSLQGTMQSNNNSTTINKRKTSSNSSNHSNDCQTKLIGQTNNSQAISSLLAMTNSYSTNASANVPMASQNGHQARSRQQQQSIRGNDESQAGVMGEQMETNVLGRTQELLELCLMNSQLSQYSPSILAMSSMAVAIDGLNTLEGTRWRLDDIVAQIHESTYKVNNLEQMIDVAIKIEKYANCFRRFGPAATALFEVPIHLIGSTTPAATPPPPPPAPPQSTSPLTQNLKAIPNDCSSSSLVASPLQIRQHLTPRDRALFGRSINQTNRAYPRPRSVSESRARAKLGFLWKRKGSTRGSYGGVGERARAARCLFK